MALCRHHHFGALVKVQRLEDTGRFLAEVTIRCTDCNEPFHFIGVDMGLSMEHPMVAVDGLELRAPIAPGVAPFLGKLQ